LTSWLRNTVSAYLVSKKLELEVSWPCLSVTRHETEFANHFRLIYLIDSIYHDAETGILFANFRYIGYDYAGDMEKMRDNPKVREWWKMTDGWQESLVPGAQSSESGEPSWWKPVEEVFYQP